MDEYTAYVYEIQRYLRTISKAYPEIEPIIPDGIFGPETTKAVKDFQRMVKLPQTGKVDLDTWNMLVEVRNKVIYEYSKPRQVAPISNEDLPLKLNDNNDFVGVLQHMLRHISNLYDNIPKVNATGQFDKTTQEAVLIWQKVAALPRTGEVDKDTWNSLAVFYTSN